MKLQLHFKCIDKNFSQEYADQYNQGKPDINNMKYHWSVSFDILNVLEIKLMEEPYSTKIEFNDGSIEEVVVDDFHKIKVLIEGGTSREYGMSRSLLRNTHKVFMEKEGVHRYYFYINYFQDIETVKHGLYIRGCDIISSLNSKLSSGTR